MWVLIQNDWCPNRRGRHRLTGRTPGDDISRDGSDSVARQGKSRIKSPHQRPPRGKKRIYSESQEVWLS